MVPSRLSDGDAVLGLGDQVDGPHLGGQGQFGRGKDGALCQRGQETALPTLVHFATLQGIAVLMPAFWAAEALWPGLGGIVLRCRMWRGIVEN